MKKSIDEYLKELERELGQARQRIGQLEAQERYLLARLRAGHGSAEARLERAEIAARGTLIKINHLLGVPDEQGRSLTIDQVRG